MFFNEHRPFRCFQFRFRPGRKVQRTAVHEASYRSRPRFSDTKQRNCNKLDGAGERRAPDGLNPDEITMKLISVRLPLVIAIFSLLCLNVPLNIAGARDGGEKIDAALYSNDWRTTGPPGGDVRALVVDPSDPDRFYFGTLDGQIYTSTDGGRQWRLLYNFGKPKMFVELA